MQHGEATSRYPVFKRYTYPALLAAVVAAAVLAVIGLGNPLGNAIGQHPFEAKAQQGSVLVLATTDQDRAEEVAAWANRYQRALSDFLGVKAGPVMIKLFEDQSDYQAYGRAYVPGFHPQMEYCYSRAHRSIYAYDLKQRHLESRLGHEMVHALVHQRFPALPLWLDEGLGELIESYRLSHDDSFAFDGVQNGWMRIARRSADSDLHTPEQLPRVRPDQFYHPNERIWYALAYATALKLDREGRLASAVAGEPVRMSAEAWRAFINDPRAWSRDGGPFEFRSPAGTVWQIPTTSHN